MIVEIDDKALPEDLTPEERAQYEADIEILRTKNIPHGRLETSVSGAWDVVRDITSSRISPGNFYYRIVDRAVDANGNFLSILAREDYDSEELRPKP